MEKFFYESRPFNLLLIALLCTKWVGNDWMGITSVATLGMASLIIFRWRYVHRHQVAPAKRR